MSELTVFTDGGARGNPGPAAAGIVITLDGVELFKGGKFLGTATNNIAEYQALILAYNWIVTNLKEKKFSDINFYLDSELIVKQLKGEYRVKDKELQKLFDKVKDREGKIALAISYTHVPRNKNKIADKIVNKVLDSQG